MGVPKRKATAEPWLPAPYDIADAAALQALEKGIASEAQQMRALAYIVKTLGMTYEHTHYPDERNTCFANGRRWVGLQIVKLLRIDLKELQQKKGP